MKDHAEPATIVSQADLSNYFVHSLLRAHNWQNRPQLDHVCDWWRHGGRGVCALIGMGGAGKTAVAERFLRILTGGLPVDPQVDKDPSLPTPHCTFIFSFYDAPNADAFFESLQMWLEGTPRTGTLLSVGQMLFLLQQKQGLIVLDGLERVQDDGRRGEFGRLHSPRLRDFLNQLAGGNFSDLGVLVTSRFPLADLRDKNPRFFHPIPVNQIDLAAGVQLLRDRGVRGAVPQLEPIVEQCGRHALTVDFAGGYIAEYGQGDPATPLNLSVGVPPSGGLEEDRLKPALQHEDELDEDQREVLRQGYRFARIAEHYRDAMLDKDEAAMALLERICLFRLGVDSKTLAAIFTGEQAVEVSGQALAALNAEQLQSKLDWLVRMRIVESSLWHGGPHRDEPAARAENTAGTAVPQYSIHPAVRDGFLSGISAGAALAGHEAVRKGLEVSLGDDPGENPSDPATLDLLEEIVHHTLSADRTREAWFFLQHRIGGYRNLVWRLGDYSRYRRLTTAFLNVNSRGSLNSPNEDDLVRSGSKLGKTAHSLLINDVGLLLMHEGRLDESIAFSQSVIDFDSGRNDLKATSNSCRNQICALFLKGALRQAVKTSEHAYELAMKSDAWELNRSLAAVGYAAGLTGDVGRALRVFRESFWIDRNDRSWRPDSALYTMRRLWRPQLLARIGNSGTAKRLINQSQEEFRPVFGDEFELTPLLDVFLAAIAIDRNCLDEASSAVCRAKDWALARDAKEVLCWSCLVEAQHEICRVRARTHQAATEDAAETVRASRAPYENAHTALESGLTIARDCGYGLYHIDLLLERARLHLLRGDAGAALDDIELALGDEAGGGGIPADEETGQPELLAARHPACGYAWPIPAALQLRAEALLLQAAQELQAVGWAEPASPTTRAGRGNWWDSLRSAHPTIWQLVNDAAANLNEALDLWQPLHDPEPERDDQNFKLNGKEYNYKAAETHEILVQLERGVLTRYPLVPTDESKNDSLADPGVDTDTSHFDVFLSHNSDDTPDVKRLGEALKKRGLTVWLDVWELAPGSSWVDELENIVTTCGSSAVCVGANGLGPWEEPEMQALLIRFMKEKKSGNAAPVIPVLLPDAPADVQLPVFLQTLTWLDLRDGLKKESLDRLQWGITGIKP